MDLNALRAATQGISAHRELMGTAIMQMTDQIFLMLAYQNGENALNAYAELFYALRKEGCEGLGDWLWDYLRYTETPYARLMEREIGRAHV